MNQSTRIALIDFIDTLEDLVVQTLRADRIEDFVESAENLKESIKSDETIP